MGCLTMKRQFRIKIKIIMTNIWLNQCLPIFKIYGLQQNNKIIDKNNHEWYKSWLSTAKDLIWYKTRIYSMITLSLIVSYIESKIY